MNPSPDHETDARKRSWGLEATGKLPAGFSEQHYPLTAAELLELRRLKAAMELAEDADTYVALARGRPIPRTNSWFRKRIAGLQHRR